MMFDKGAVCKSALDSNQTVCIPAATFYWIAAGVYVRRWNLSRLRHVIETERIQAIRHLAEQLW